MLRFKQSSVPPTFFDSESTEKQLSFCSVASCTSVHFAGGIGSYVFFSQHFSINDKFSQFTRSPLTLNLSSPIGGVPYGILKKLMYSVSRAEVVFTPRTCPYSVSAITDIIVEEEKRCRYFFLVMND